MFTTSPLPSMTALARRESRAREALSATKWRNHSGGMTTLGNGDEPESAGKPDAPQRLRLERTGCRNREACGVRGFTPAFRTRFTESPPFLADLLSGHEPGRASLPASRNQDESTTARRDLRPTTSGKLMGGLQPMVKFARCAVVSALMLAAGTRAVFGGADAPGDEAGAVHAAVPARLVRREFRDVGTLFANPGQGWMSQQRRPRGDPRFPCAVVYVRFNWADAEPEEGRFNWALTDDVIAAWKARGAAVAMRVMTCNAHSAGYYASPQWLFDAGCPGHEYLVGGDDPTSGGQRIPRIEPDYADPMYLEKHGAFLKALGERYDGRPEVEFLDIGSYGVWGEWHTKHPAPVAVRQQIVDLYLRAFQKTPLVFMSDDAEVLPYALAHGTGFRRAGVGSPWHEQNWIGSGRYAGVAGMADTWKRAPVVFEWFGDYAYLQSRQWSFEAAVEFMLRNHVTLINDNIGRVPPEAMPQLEKLARLAGARLVLRELAHERVARAGAELNVQMRWANVGVGKLYRPYVLRFFLSDAVGQSVLTTDAQADPREWLPGDHDLGAQLRLPSALKPGEYILALALVDPAGRGRPFRLAMAAPEHEGRYEVSRIQIE